MEALFAAVEGAEAATPVIADSPGAEAPVEESASAKKTGGRCGKVEAAQKRMATAEAKVISVATKLEKKQGECLARPPAPGTQRAKEVEKLKASKAKAEASLAAAREDVQQAMQSSAAKAASDEKAAADKAAKAAANAAMSDEGRVAAVQEKFKEEDRIRNTKEKVILVWETIWANWCKRIDDGELLEADRRDCKALNAKFLKDQGLFRQLTQHLQRAASSGASREELERISLNSQWRNATSDTFFYYDQHNAPMSVPPHVINGGNAARGGDGNFIKEILKRQAEEEDEGEGEGEGEEDEEAGTYSVLEEGEVDPDDPELATEADEGWCQTSEDDESPLAKKPQGEPKGVHPPAQSSKKYRPIQTRVSKSPGSKPDDFARALRDEGAADRLAAKKARQAAMAEASKARKHERSMLLMLMQAMQGGNKRAKHK